MDENLKDCKKVLKHIHKELAREFNLQDGDYIILSKERVGYWIQEIAGLWHSWEPSPSPSPPPEE